LTSLEQQTGYSLRVVDSPDAGNRLVTLRTGRVPFWQAVEQVALAARMRADAVPPPATDPGILVFVNDLPRDRLTTPISEVGPEVLTGLLRGSARLEGELRTRHAGAVVFRPGRRGSESLAQAVGAIRVRAVSFPGLPAYPPDLIPVILHLACEPRYVWKGVTGVEIVQASDETGHELDCDPVDGPVVLRAVGLPDDGAVATLISRDIKPAAGEGSFPAPALAFVKLSVPEAGSPVRRLATLRGEIRGEVWDAPEDIGVAAVGKPGKVTRSTGRYGVTFEVLYTPAQAEEPARMTVVVGYDPRLVRPVGGDPWPLSAFLIGGAPTDGEPLTITDTKPPSDPVREAFGLSVWDASGEPFELSVTANKYQLSSVNGLAVQTQVIGMQLTSTAAAPQPPASVRFRGSATVPVRIPFTLTDIPVAAGTRK
jgi:hypothetical protein